MADLLDLTKKIGCNPIVTNTNETSSKYPGASSKNSGSSRGSQASTKTFLWVAIASTALAILDHGYLLAEHYRLRFGEAGGKSLCDISETMSCAAVSASKYSEFLGVPMAMWGAAANLVLLLLLAWWPMTDENKKPAARRNILLVSGFIAIASIVMGAVSSFLIQKLCPFCILAYVLSFISFGAAWLALRPSASRGTKALSIPGFQFSDLTPVLVLAAIGAVGSMIANDQVKKSYGFRDMGPFVQEKVAEWASSPQVQINTLQPLVKGASPENAKMTIVEFADFRCIHCKHASPVLKAFVNAHPDTRLEFQAWPLDGECNSAISRANNASCLLARTVYCAEKAAPGTGKGWSAHDYVFENQERWVSVDAIKGAYAEIASASGIAADQLATCADSDEAKEAVKKQADVGVGLNLQGTPTIYVNGRKLQAGQVLSVLSGVHQNLTTSK